MITLDNARNRVPNREDRPALYHDLVQDAKTAGVIHPRAVAVLNLIIAAERAVGRLSINEVVFDIIGELDKPLPETDNDD